MDKVARFALNTTQRYSSENNQVQQAKREPPFSGNSLEPKRPQWFLISEDHSLSLRLVSGAILCEGDDGQLVVSAQDAAHAARFDIIEDELWLSCVAGHVRADGQLIAHHRRVESGAQLQIGITRYFVADTINETMPDIPLLQNRYEASDTRLPKPGGRHFPVFYEGPLEIEEIIITEAVSRDAGLDGTPDAAVNPALDATPDARRSGTTPDDSDTPKAALLSTTEIRASHPSPARSTGIGRNRLLTAPAIIGLGAALAYAGYQVATRDGLNLSLPGAGDTFAVPIAATNAAGRNVGQPVDPGIASEPGELRVPRGIEGSLQTEFAHLAWADGISAANHERVVELIKLLDRQLNEPDNRASLERYAERLLTIDDADQLEPLVLSFGRAVSSQPVLREQWRDLLARLEMRVINLSKEAPMGTTPAETQLPNSEPTALTAISLLVQSDAGL